MKPLKYLWLILVSFTLTLALASCGGTDPDPGTIPDNPNLDNITGITFVNQSFDYDGTEKSISVSGTLPEGVSVTYTDNKGTNAGTYYAKAVLSGEGYNTLTLNATLTINKANMSGLSLTDGTYSYDGTTRTVALVGTPPTGSSVVYSGGEDGENSATNAGNYTINVTVTNPNYNTFTASATLKIAKINFQNLSFTGSSYTYDTDEHKITLTGNVPGDATVTYTGGEDGKNGATSVGSYDITVTVSHKNYNTFTATATLKITTSEEKLSVSFFDGNVYFQNTLDGKYLYSYDGTALEFVSRDKPSSVVVSGGEMFYISNGIFSSGIFIFDPTTGRSDCLFEVSSADTLLSDGTYLYYNINKLIGGADNGIYRIKIADLKNEEVEITPTKLTSVKSGDMTIAEGRIYFSNRDDGGKLYSVSTSANNATPLKLYDYKVSELISDDDKIFFVRKTLTGSAIFSINVSGGLSALQSDESSKVIKITMSNGKYLTVIGDYIYFVNTDMVTSTIFGDGIYRAKKDGSGWISDVYTNLIGATKVVDGSDDNIFGLTTDGDVLYYFRANTKHLFTYDISECDENDLMDGFVPPERIDPILTYYEKAEEYNGEIYYVNMKDGGKLYKFNPVTNLDVRMTNLAVADFAINDGVIYYATTRLLVNFDLYRMNLTTGELERISTDKCMNFSFHDGKLYYTNFSGKNTLNVINLETLEDIEIFGKDVVSGGKAVEDGLTTVYNGKLYFVADSLLYSYDLTSGAVAVVNNNLKPLEYIMYDGKILMMNCDGFQNNITVYDIATNRVNKIGNLGISGISDDLRGMFVYNGEMYFYRNVAAGSTSKGLYKIVLDGNSYSAVLVDKIEGYYMCESVVIGNKVYFLDVWQVKGTVPTTSSTGKLCALDMTTKTVTVLN